MNTAALTPHGSGFSFVDEICDIEAGKKIKTRKRLSPDMDFFKHHFPQQPLMPGVLLVECAAQAAGCLWGSIHETEKPKPYNLAQVLQFKFIKPALPGDLLEISAVLEKDFGTLAQFSAQIEANGHILAVGKLVLGQP